MVPGSAIIFMIQNTCDFAILIANSFLLSDDKSSSWTFSNLSANHCLSSSVLMREKNEREWSKAEMGGMNQNGHQQTHNWVYTWQANITHTHTCINKHTSM